MKSLARSSMRSLVATMLCTVAASGLAQTPAQLEYERQQREYWRQQEQQRQEQQRQQQLMQDNARRQQEESSRINAPAGQTPGGAAPGGDQGRGGVAHPRPRLSRLERAEVELGRAARAWRRDFARSEGSRRGPGPVQSKKDAPGGASVH